MKKLAKWFTDARRQAIQAAVATLVPVVVLFGVVSQDQAAVLLTAAGATLQVAQGITGLALLRASDAARWFSTTGRGLVYTLAGAVGPVGTSFRWWGEDTAGTILTVTGLALTSLAAFTQIVNVQTVPSTVKLPDPAKSTREEYQAAKDAGA